LFRTTGDAQLALNAEVLVETDCIPIGYRDDRMARLLFDYIASRLGFSNSALSGGFVRWLPSLRISGAPQRKPVMKLEASGVVT